MRAGVITPAKKKPTQALKAVLDKKVLPVLLLCVNGLVQFEDSEILASSTGESFRNAGGAIASASAIDIWWELIHVDASGDAASDSGSDTD